MKESAVPKKAKTERTFDVFFYGLYMDADLLKSKGVVARDPRPALVQDHIVRLGAKAMLLRSHGRHAAGMLYQMNDREIDILYADARGYRRQRLSATVVGAEAKFRPTAVISMVHIDPPIHSSQDQDPDYCARWKNLVQRLGISGLASTEINGSPANAHPTESGRRE